MASSAHLSPLEQHITCPICLELFENPLQLLCGHNLCTKCLEVILGGVRTASCPECRQPITAINGIAGFNKSFQLAGIVSAYKQINAAEVQIQKCDIECQEHGKRCKLFCETCKELSCSSCVTGARHKGHVWMSTDEAYKHFKAHLHEEILPQISEKEKRIGNIEIEYKCRIQSLEKSTSKAKSEVRDNYCQLLAMLDKKKEVAMKEIDVRAAKRKRIIDEAEAKNSETKRLLADTRQETEEALTYASDKLLKETRALSNRFARALDEANEKIERTPDSLPAFEFGTETLQTDIQHIRMKWMKDKVKERALLSFKVDNISELKLEEKALSPPVVVWNLSWNIMVKPRQVKNEKKLAVFLKCSANLDSKSWSCHAEADLRIKSYKSGGQDFQRSIKHLFSPNADDWGFRVFISWKELIDPEKEYVKDDQMTVEVHMNTHVDSPDGVNDLEYMIQDDDDDNDED